jgi:hypothetical protein
VVPCRERDTEGFEGLFRALRALLLSLEGLFRALPLLLSFIAIGLLTFVLWDVELRVREVGEQGLKVDDFLAAEIRATPILTAALLAALLAAIFSIFMRLEVIAQTRAIGITGFACSSIGLIIGLLWPGPITGLFLPVGLALLWAAQQMNARISKQDPSNGRT